MIAIEGKLQAEMAARIRRLSRPMDPISTGVAAVLHRQTDVRAVLFDVYGTLFISGSGDIGTLQRTHAAQAATEALEAAGYHCRTAASGQAAADFFRDLMEEEHAGRRAAGVEFPEVDIRRIWHATVSRLLATGEISGDLQEVRLLRLAVEYECRVNPVWPMPGLKELIAALAGKGVILGLISNAQFMTPLLFDAFLGGSPAELGLRDELCIYSFRHGVGKPAVDLYEQARDVLRDIFRVESGEVLYLGNDMLNDVWGASRCGFRGVLFAGDRRSLRLRDEDERCRRAEPAAVVTALGQLPQLLE